MGRCNNRRTQQQAQALQNTPARARFSKKPPQQRKRRNNRNAQQQAVVDKISNRVGQQHKTAGGTVLPIIPTVTSSSSTKASSVALSTKQVSRDTLNGVDLKKLDEIKLPAESTELIDRILKDLGVVQDSTDQVAPSRSKDFSVEAEVHDMALGEEDLSWREEDIEAGPIVTRPVISLQRDAEYNDDFLEDEPMNMMYGTAPSMGNDYDIEWEGGGQGKGSPKVLVSQSTEVTDQLSESARAEKEDFGELRKDPIFDHLTQTFSFTERSAARACEAVSNSYWQAATNDKSDQTVASEERTDDPLQQQQTLGLALDWLSLHLSASELEAGFKRRRGHGGALESNRTIRQQVKAIPHPSISVAPKLTENSEILETARLEEQAVGFMQLGFEYADIMEVLKGKTDGDGIEQDALDDEVTLRRLLAMSETKAAENSKTLASDILERVEVSTEEVDILLLQDEREQEKEALSAIYDQGFVVDNSSELGRYKIVLLPHDGSETESSGQGELHVFLLSGYPLVELPLFMYYRRNCPPVLLRRINTRIREAALASKGTPCIFEIVTLLAEDLETLEDEFKKEMKRRDFEEEQTRLRLQAGHDLSADGWDDGKEQVGRRQRAKVKSKEKAFSRINELEQEEQERLQRQKDRLDKIHHLNNNLRPFMVEQTLERLEKEHHEVALRKTGRAAMLDSLNRGESVEEARKASSEAEQRYLIENGLIKSPDRVEETQWAHGTVDTLSDEENELDNKATPNTLAFMDRLRSMYQRAALQKGNFDLSPPIEADEKTESYSHLPRPVAVPVGDLAEMMEDVIDIQNEQPWLISSEARVPSSAESRVFVEDEQMELDGKRDDLSMALKRELESKIAAGGQANKSQQAYQTMLEQRARLPAYQMKDEIVSAIARNQVTVVAGDTGCGECE